MKFTNVRLLVGDFAASLHFWRDVMQMPLKYSDDAMGYAYFDLDTSGIELVRRNEFAEALGAPAPPPAAGWQALLDFKVDDVDTAYANLVARGATPVAAPQDRPVW